MRRIATAILILGLALPAHAQQIDSAYTQLDAERACTIYEAAEPDEGDWAYLACNGHLGYPILISYSDLRESLFYGFPPESEEWPKWESFAGFNRTGPTVEWRLETAGERRVPFATIHRWFVSSGDEGREVEVLVVQRVGQVRDRQGCVVGYVVASGNANANVKARNVADTHARGFQCGIDEPVVEAGSVPLPPPSRF